MRMRLSDYIAEYLEVQQKCTRVFLLSGGGMMHLLDAVSRRSELKFICNHHEQASAMAAEAYARRSGRLGVCYATSGPGGTNTITGVVGAWQDSSPVLFISGQSKLSQTIQHTGIQGLRQFGTFEVDIIPMVRSITKYSAFINDPSMIRYHLEKACHFALSGRPGPVFLDIPVDIQGALIEPEKLKGFDPAELSSASQTVSDSTIEAILDRISQAKRPLVLGGHGVRCSKSVDEFRSLIRELNIPVVTTPLAIDLVEYQNPLLIGHPGMKGDRPGNFAVQTADLIIVLGSSLHVTTTGYELDQFATKAYKIQVEPDAAVLQREQVGVNEKICCGVDTFIRKMKERLAHRISSGKTLISTGPWHERCQLWKTELAVRNEPHKSESGKNNYYDLIDALSDLCEGDETITADAGSAFYVVGQAFRTKKNQRVISSGALGTMGFAVPAATGACAAAPDTTVICVTGDGSLQTNIHELATIRHNSMNAKMFIVNNDGYVSIRNTQNNFFAGHLAGTSRSSGVSFPNLEKLAAAYDIPYFKAEQKSELKEVVGKALKHPGPVICEVFTPANQEILPTVSSVRLENGSMRSKPLHDMFPFMDEATFKKYMDF